VLAGLSVRRSEARADARKIRRRPIDPATLEPASTSPSPAGASALVREGTLVRIRSVRAEGGTTRLNPLSKVASGYDKYEIMKDAPEDVDHLTSLLQTISVSIARAASYAVAGPLTE
jgi:hypothetical protein